MIIDRDILDRALETVRAAWPRTAPACGLILGSGWGNVAEIFTEDASLPYDRVPGLGLPGVTGHAGILRRGRLHGLETLVFQGRRHWYEGGGWTPVAIPVFLLTQLGARVLVLTNAAGSLAADLVPGSVVVIRDHINMMGSNPLIGTHDPAWGPRFPDMTNAYDNRLRTLLAACAQELNIALREGVYLATSGPSYETPAEIRAFEIVGADMVGMSTVPEAMLARAAGMRVAALSCITNFAAGISRSPLSHDEVARVASETLPVMSRLLDRFWEKLPNEIGEV